MWELTFRRCDSPQGGMLERCVSRWRGVMLMAEVHRSFGMCDSCLEV